jgi:hypothetical protein
MGGSAQNLPVLPDEAFFFPLSFDARHRLAATGEPYLSICFSATSASMSK